MVFENGVKSIQAAAYNGARTVFRFYIANLAYITLDTTFLQMRLRCKLIMARIENKKAPRSIREVVKFASIFNTSINPMGKTDMISRV